jgi:hypothetical protein
VHVDLDATTAQAMVGAVVVLGDVGERFDLASLDRGAHLDRDAVHELGHDDDQGDEGDAALDRQQQAKFTKAA